MGRRVRETPASGMTLRRSKSRLVMNGCSANYRMRAHARCAATEDWPRRAVDVTRRRCPRAGPATWESSLEP
jgi:hypothetical protein